MSTIAAVIGRLMLALIFVVSGIQKIIDPTPTAQMLVSKSLPATLAMPTGIFELVAGLLLALGIMTRLASFLLAGFTLLTIFFFHNQFGDPMQATQALKNTAIAGGLLVVFAYGQMRWSYDHMRATRRGEVVDGYRGVLEMKGDAERGKQLYRAITVSPAVDFSSIEEVLITLGEAIRRVGLMIGVGAAGGVFPAAVAQSHHWGDGALGRVFHRHRAARPTVRACSSSWRLSAASSRR